MHNSPVSIKWKDFIFCCTIFLDVICVTEFWIALSLFKPSDKIGISEVVVADFFKARRRNDCLSLCNSVKTPCIARSNAVTVPPLPCSPPSYVVPETAFVVKLLHNWSSVGKILHGKSGSSDVIGFISRNHALPGLVCHLQEHVLLTSYRGVIRSRNRRFYFYLHQIFQNITINFRITTLL